MSLLLRISRFSKLRRLEKHFSARASLPRSNGFSSYSVQTPPCDVNWVSSCGAGLGRLVVLNAHEISYTKLDKKVPLELDEMVTIGASHGWVATLKDDGILRLQDDLNPAASETNPKRISLPPLVTLPQCQTRIITNLSMSSPSPEEEDCVVAVKFLGPQLSFCRPGQSRTEWTNIRIEDPCFHSSRVMFSKRHEMFCMPGSGGHLIGSWDPHADNPEPKFQRLRFQNLPELSKTKREMLLSCATSDHLVESRPTGETFLVKWYRKANKSGRVKMKTRAVMVFKLDEEGNAVYTNDIGDLSIFLSKSEPFCVLGSSLPGMICNLVRVLDVEESAYVSVRYSYVHSVNCSLMAYHIPPQNIN